MMNVECSYSNTGSTSGENNKKVTVKPTVLWNSNIEASFNALPPPPPSHDHSPFTEYRVKLIFVCPSTKMAILGGFLAIRRELVSLSFFRDEQVVLVPSAPNLAPG